MSMDNPYALTMPPYAQQYLGAGAYQQPANTYESNFSSAPTDPSGGGFLGGLKTVGSFLTGGVAGGLLSLVGIGLDYVLNNEERKKQEKAAQKRFEQQMAAQKEQFEKNYALATDHFGLTKTQYADQLKRQRQLDALGRDDRNAEKMTGIQQQFLMTLNNNNAMKDRLLQLSGLRR